MTDHVTHLTAKTVRHIFGWTILSTFLGSIIVTVLSVAIKSHDYEALVYGGLALIVGVGVGLVCS